MREADNIREVEALGVDWMGFIFWPRSTRFVRERPTYLPTRCRRVGIFVDAEPDVVRRTADDFALDLIQLHGSESPEYLRQLAGFSIIKAFNIATAADLQQTCAYAGLADYFLFDTKAVLPGGSGQQFDWSVLAGYVGEIPFLLSGGLGPADAPRLRSFRHPRCAGFDLNSRFELAPARKDVAALSRFISKL